MEPIHLTGQAMVRPVHLCIIANATVADILNAMQTSSTLWGGVYNQIFIDDTEPDRLLHRSDLTFLDSIVSIGPADQHRPLTTLPGAEYNHVGRRHDVFDGPTPFQNSSPISVEWLLERYPGVRKPIQLEIEPSDPLALLLTALVGDIRQGRPYGLSDRFERLPLTSGGDVSLLLRDWYPIRVTSQETTFISPESIRGVYFVDPDDVRGIANFWNLRALGVDIFPYPSTNDRRLDYALVTWLQNPKLAPVIRGDLESVTLESQQRISVWNTTAPGAMPPHLHSLIAAAGGIANLTEIERPLVYTETSQVLTRFEEHFTTSSATVLGKNIGITIPVPSIRPSYSRSPIIDGVVAVDISLESEENVPPGYSARIPPLRSLARKARSLQNMSAFERATPGGRTLGVDSSSRSAIINYLPVVDIFEPLLKDRSWKLSQSDNGLFAERMAQRFGGLDSAAMNEPAVRNVLYEARNAERALPYGRLLSAARRDVGSWPESHFAGDYGVFSVNRLIASRLLQPAQKVRCPVCANSFDASADELSTTMHCHMCNETFQLGLALAVDRKSPAWSYRLAPNVQPGLLAESLAILPVASVLSALSTGSNSTRLRMIGMKLDSRDHSCEIDIVQLVTRLTSTLVVGEIKSTRDSISAADVANLERVQGVVVAAGLDSVILCATLRTSFSAEEVVLIREHCERSIMEAGEGSEIRLPLLLTSAELSVDWLDTAHPCRWSNVGDNLASICIESCRRHIGLNRIGRDNTSGKQALKWAE